MAKHRSRIPHLKGLDDVFEALRELAGHIDVRFDQVAADFQAVNKRLDVIQFAIAGQERRISTLEDRMRMIATKLGLEFRK